MTDSENAAEHSEPKQKIHEEMRARLVDYATAEALGKNAEEEYPDVADYLDATPELRDELEELRSLVAAVYAGEIEAAPAYPEPDLSFLETDQVATEAADSRWHWTEHGQMMIEFTEALLDLLRPPALAGAMRGQLLYTYEVEEMAERGIDVRVEVFSEGAEQETVTVSVTVDVRDAEPLAQGGSEVSLHAEDQTWSGETDDAGYVEFAHVPLSAVPDLRIEVTPA